MQESLRDAAARAMNDSDVDAVILMGAGNTFIAGADIRQLERMARDGAVQSILPQVVREIEAAPKPFVAAIHGNAFGGGLEVALAAHYRIATPEARIGQPEVKLGIIPGAGGTQRLPRLAGVETALEMCVFGEPVGADDAMRFGIIDRIAEGDLLACAIQFAQEVSRLGPRRNTRAHKKLGTPDSNASLICGLPGESAKDAQESARAHGCHRSNRGGHGVAVRRGMPQRTGNLRAAACFEPGKIPDPCVLRGARGSKDSGSRQGLCRGPDSGSRCCGRGNDGARHRHVLRERGNPGASERCEAGRPGGGHEVDRGDLPGFGAGRNESQRMKCGTGYRRSSRRLDYAGFDAADIMIEAAFENLDVKRALFAELGGLAKPGAILATNTSYLNIDEIAQACSRPEA